MSARRPFRVDWNARPKPAPLFPDECEPHTPAPTGYIQWWAWADEMAKTHRQRQCKGCGLWAIWYPKALVSAC